jgi:hypothetical protein
VGLDRLRIEARSSQDKRWVEVKSKSSLAQALDLNNFRESERAVTELIFAAALAVIP